MLLNYTDKGNGIPIVLLHGMASSKRYWDSYLDDLSKKNRVIAVDLLGFGHSPKPRNAYTLEDHTLALKETLSSIGVLSPIKLVGHSMGARVALSYANKYPNEVNKLSLISMPLYHSSNEARSSITKQKLKFRLAYYGPTSFLLCTLWCKLLRPLSSRMAHIYLPRFPKIVAEESVLHTWHSFSCTLHNVIENNDGINELHQLSQPTQIIYGDNDDKTVIQNVKALTALPKNVLLTILPGTHNLPLENQALLISLISE